MEPLEAFVAVFGSIGLGAVINVAADIAKGRLGRADRETMEHATCPSCGHPATVYVRTLAGLECRPCTERLNS